MKSDHIFIDIKTTGAKVESGEILDFACIRTDRRGEIYAAYADRVRPEGTGPTNIPTLREVLDNTKKIVLDETRFDQKFVVIAHFADYVRPHVEEACRKVQIPFIFHGRAWIDTAQLAWPLVFDDLVSGRSLRSLAIFLGASDHGENTAQGDVNVLRLVYFTLLRRISTGILADNHARAFGGEVYNKFQRLLRGY